MVTIAGAHGLWLLPTILSLVGGSKAAPERLGKLFEVWELTPGDKIDLRAKNRR